MDDNTAQVLIFLLVVVAIVAIVWLDGRKRK